MYNNFNRVLCKGVNGIYKDKQLEIKIGKTHADSSVKVNGTTVKNVTACYIKIVPHKITTVTLEIDKDQQ